MLNVPTIDIRRFQNGVMSQTQFAELTAACEDHGFFLLSGHGQDALIAETFAQSAGFFAQPREAKLSVARNELNPLGYYDRELTKQKRDLKEVFDFKAGGYISKDPARQTRWPEWDPQFRQVLTEFFIAFTRLSEQTMRMVYKSLGMPDAQAQQMLVDGFGAQHSSAARLNYYPADDPVPAAERDSVKALGDLALHHHTDPGAITLLLQDDHGGLQALSKTDGWIDVPPQPGTIVVNIGDVLQVWTNDRCTAGVHRVLPVHSPTGRFSTPFFYQPRYDAQIKPWVGDDGIAHYRAFSWREFIRGRVSDNFADYGAEDVQIDRYKRA